MKQIKGTLTVVLKRFWKSQLLFVVGMLCTLVLFGFALTMALRMTAFSGLAKLDDIAFIEHISQETLNSFDEGSVVGKVSYNSWTVDRDKLDEIVTATQIDIDVAETVSVPLSRGHWFKRGDGAQVIVSESLKKHYKLNKTYDFQVNKSFDIEPKIEIISAKVVGYLSDGDYTIAATSRNMFSFVSSSEKILFCGEVEFTKFGESKNQWFGGAFLKLTDQTKAYLENERRNFSIADDYAAYKETQSPTMFVLDMCFLGIAMVSITTILMNSIMGKQRKEKYYSIAHICGAPPWAMVASQAIISLGSIVISAFLAYIICCGFTMPLNHKNVKLMTWSGFWVAVALTSALQLISGALFAIEVYNIKPLKCLKKD